MAPRKIIIDCDPGIDDAVALCLALFDPRLDVLAVTTSAGNIDAPRASRNVQTILEHLDPPRWPRVAGIRPEDSPVTIDNRVLHGVDGLGNMGAKISELHNQHLADKVIADTIRQAPGQVTVVALGPLTNIARALTKDPELCTRIDQVVISGGCVNGIGNFSQSAEFNMLADPESARVVLRSPVTKTLVPLDVTSQLVFSLDLLDELPEETTRAGRFLRQVLPHLFRSYRQHLGMEGIWLQDALATLVTVQADLFRTEEMAGDVEVSGSLTRGMTVFDRRVRRVWRANMDVVVGADLLELREALVRGLKFAGQETRDSAG